MTTRVIYRDCPFCEDELYYAEKWRENLWLLKCANPKIVSSFWAERKPNGKFNFVEIKRENYSKMSSYQKQEFEKLQIPFWKLMGQKPKEKDIAYEKALKWKGMTYGDAVLARNAQGEESSAMPQVEEALIGEGRNNVPQYQKSS